MNEVQVERERERWGNNKLSKRGVSRRNFYERRFERSNGGADGERGVTDAGPVVEGGETGAFSGVIGAVADGAGGGNAEKSYAGGGRPSSAAAAQQQKRNLMRIRASNGIRTGAGRLRHPRSPPLPNKTKRSVV